MNLTDLREGGFPASVTRQQLVKQLVDRYPDYPWQKAWLMRGRFAQQKRLENAVNTLFEVRLISNYTKCKLKAEFTKGRGSENKRERCGSGSSRYWGANGTGCVCPFEEFSF